MLKKIVLEKIVPPLLEEFCLQLTFGLIYFIPPEYFHFLYWFWQDFWPHCTDSTLSATIASVTTPFFSGAVPTVRLAA